MTQDEFRRAMNEAKRQDTLCFLMHGGREVVGLGYNSQKDTAIIRDLRVRASATLSMPTGARESDEYKPLITEEISEAEEVPLSELREGFE